MKRAHLSLDQSEGFTLIELTLAMAIFSFMLLIVVSGFINVVHIHNRAVALNNAQDNARSALDQVMQAIRNSSSSNEPTVTGLAPLGAVLCLQNTSGPEQTFYIQSGVLKRADGCVARLNEQALTNPDVNVVDFDPTVVDAAGSAGSKPDVEVTLTVATNNGTTDSSTSGEGTKCGVGSASQTFCSVVTLKSGATPR